MKLFKVKHKQAAKHLLEVVKSKSISAFWFLVSLGDKDTERRLKDELEAKGTFELCLAAFTFGAAVMFLIIAFISFSFGG